MNSDNRTLALVKLMELFNHSSVTITKKIFRFKAGRTTKYLYDCLSFYLLECDKV